MADASESAGARPRRGAFRTWEIVVILIAVVLFVLAAVAGPSDPPPPPVAQPTAGTSAGPTSSPAGSPTPSATTSGTPSPVATPTDVATGSPVATPDQILAEEVGDYMLVDRMPAEVEPESGALQAVDLRYALTPPEEDTDILHAIEIHPDDVAAEQRVKTFGAALEQTGYRVLREQSLRGDDGTVQGYFISLRGEGQPLLLWSNRNATFTLGGGPDADVNAFYDSLPY